MRRAFMALALKASPADIRRAERERDALRVKRITDRGGIAGLVLKSDRIGP
jgi:hypothetical protein